MTLDMLKELVAIQARDPGLWCDAESAEETYLQAALRVLHEAIEKLE